MEAEGVARTSTTDAPRVVAQSTLGELTLALGALATRASNGQVAVEDLRGEYQALASQLPQGHGLNPTLIHAQSKVLAELLRLEAKANGETISPAQAMERVAAALITKIEAERPAPNPTATEIIKRWSKDWQGALRPKAPDEAAFHQEAAGVIADIQKAFSDQGKICRAQHAKALYVTADASFQAETRLPPELNYGAFAETAPLRAIVRISSVSGRAESDDKPDLRGIAIRLTDDKGHVQDLLLNTSEQFMAADAKGALVGAEARGKGPLALVKGIVQGRIGVVDTVKMAIAGKQVQSKDKSLAAHTFWSRTPFQLGDYAVKIRLRPAVDVLPTLAGHGPDELHEDFLIKLKYGPVRYKLEVQGFESKETTPLDDARETWSTPWVTVGELTFGKHDPNVPSDSVARVEKEIDQLAYGISNRWDADERSLKGLGDINAMREGGAYKASADGRGVDPTQSKRCPYGFG
jgi:hypothetical protein